MVCDREEQVFQRDLSTKPQAYRVVIDFSESTKIQACSPNINHHRNLKFHFFYVIICIIIFMLSFLLFFTVIFKLFVYWSKVR